MTLARGETLLLADDSTEVRKWRPCFSGVPNARSARYPDSPPTGGPICRSVPGTYTWPRQARLGT